MTPAGVVMGDMLDILGWRSNNEGIQRLWRQLNYQYFRLCAQYSWRELRSAEPETLDFDSATSSGLYLPSDLLGVDLVWDDDNSIQFWEQSRANAQPDEWGYRFFRYSGRTALFEGTDIVLSHGSNSFTSASLTADGSDPNGYYVRFGAELGLYEISSSATPFTFTPYYYGPSMTNKRFSIRPWEYTQRMVLVDPAEDVLTDREVDVYYWRMPVPLYREEDMIMLPSVEVLKLRTLRAMPEAKESFGVSESMLDGALREALKLNPTFARVRGALDKHGNVISMDTNPFGSEDETAGSSFWYARTYR